MIGFALALEVELNVVQGVAYLLEWGFWIEIGIAVGYHLAGDIIFWNQGNTYSRNRCTQSGAPGAYVSY